MKHHSIHKNIKGVLNKNNFYVKYTIIKNNVKEPVLHRLKRSMAPYNTTLFGRIRTDLFIQNL